MLQNNARSIPIIIIHNGYSKSLYYCIASSARANPNSEIFLVSNAPHKKLEKISTFVDINDMEDEQATLFERSYVHFGKSDYNFEMFCIKRWFIYRNVLKKFNLKNAFCIDSDILVFSNLQEALIDYSNYKISLVKNFGSTMYITDVSILDKFCNYLINTYTNKNEVDKLSNMYHSSGRASQGVAGTINDMILSDDFFSNYEDQSEIGDLTKIVNGATFDYNVLIPNVHVNYNSIKKSRYEVKEIYFDDKIAYCGYKNDSGEIEPSVRFHSLHFVVWSKIFMKRIFNYKNMRLNPIVINISREYQVFIKKLKKLF